MIADQFKSTISSAGFIILILGGYSAYMNKIKANNVTVSVLTKPIARIKSVYILVPIVFLLGNLLSLVVPSASNLAIILLATLYPILIQAGMSTLTAAGLIATTATIVPTPLGSDNVAIAAELAKTAEYAGMSATDYVFRYHAMVSVPTLLLMAAVHYFWQKHCDKKGTDANTELEKTAVIEEIPGGTLFRTVYVILPLLPILLLIGVFALQKLTGLSIDISVEVATLFSFVIAIICELIRTRRLFQRNGRFYADRSTARGRNDFCNRFKIYRTYLRVAECNDGNAGQRYGLCASSVTGRTDGADRTFKRKRHSTVLRNGSADGTVGCSSRDSGICSFRTDGTGRQSAACGISGIGSCNDRGGKCKAGTAGYCKENGSSYDCRYGVYVRTFYDTVSVRRMAT